MMAGIRNEELMAHLDGELPGIEDGRVARAIAEDPGLRAEAEAQRRLRERLARRYDPIAEEQIPERFRKMLETNVVTFPARAAPRRLRFAWPHAAAIAASFAVGVVAAQLAGGRDPQAGVTGAPLIAAGPLARALDTQLASTQSATAQTRIGVSFAARDGRLCRTFETPGIAGLACRESSGWNVVTSAAAAVRGGEYRQAGSAPAIVMESAQQMMAGAPFDAQAERQALEMGWTARR